MDREPVAPATLAVQLEGVPVTALALPLIAIWFGPPPHPLVHPPPPLETTTVFVLVWLCPAESEPVRETVNVPEALKAWLKVDVNPLPLSLEVQEYVYGGVPPETGAEKLPLPPVVTVPGPEMFPTVKPGGGVPLSEIDTDVVMPWTVSWTVLFPEPEYECVTSVPVVPLAWLPSPKFQLAGCPGRAKSVWSPK
jgi:hypothetical protein